MQIKFSAEGGLASAVLSKSHLRGVILNSKLALMAPDSRDVINFNIACVIFSVAFLEAKINEIITNIADGTSASKIVPQQFWIDLKNDEKRLDIKDKWDRLSYPYGGSRWESGTEPFQSFEIIQSLRNILIHYKGDYIPLGDAPQKKIKELLKRFKGAPDDYKSEAIWSAFGQGKKDWIFQLLTTSEFGRWIALKALEFDIKEKELLSGENMTDKEIMRYWSQWDQILPMTNLGTKENFKSAEKVLLVLEKVIFPEKIS